MSIRTYRELEAGELSLSFDTWDRICELYGWPQTFTAPHGVKRRGTSEGR